MPVDRYGVTMFYPTKTGGEEAYREQASIGSPSNYLYIYTSAGLNLSLASANSKKQKEMASRGYMQSPKDWRNVEVTFYAYLDISSGVYDDVNVMLRGAKHGDWYYCPGFSYKFKIAFDGMASFIKEQWHRHHAMTPWVKITNPLRKRWVGIKTVLYTTKIGDKTVVKGEFYIDETENNQWKRKHVALDAGNLGTKGEVCGGDPDQMGLWGGPSAIINCDRGILHVKKVSVREIVVQPGQNPDEPPPDVEPPPDIPDLPEVPEATTPAGYLDATMRGIYSIQGGTGFPEPPPGAGMIFRSSKHRYAIGHYATTHCFTP